jgi:hypothetical protein
MPNKGCNRQQVAVNLDVRLIKLRNITMIIYKNLKRFVRRITCNHTNAWEFFPTECNYNGQVIKGRIKLVLCWKCESVVDVTNFGQ